IVSLDKELEVSGTIGTLHGIDESAFVGEELHAEEEGEEEEEGEVQDEQEEEGEKEEVLEERRRLEEEKQKTAGASLEGEEKEESPEGIGDKGIPEEIKEASHGYTSQLSIPIVSLDKELEVSGTIGTLHGIDESAFVGEELHAEEEGEEEEEGEVQDEQEEEGEKEVKELEEEEGEGGEEEDSKMKKEVSFGIDIDDSRIDKEREMIVYGQEEEEEIWPI
ncbi:hypothetical protein ADUPG1_010505, partial [Aduncisulcus paluster]